MRYPDRMKTAARGSGLERVGRLAVVTACALLNCACVTTVDLSTQPMTRDYFGWVRVVRPVNSADSDPPVVAFDTRAVGVRMDGGFGVGWFHDQIHFVPADCRVVIFTLNQQQLDFALHHTNRLKEGLCVTTKPS